MNILGVSCYHHDSAAAALKDTHILGASHEERFTRKNMIIHFQSILYRGYRMRGKILNLLLFMKNLHILILNQRLKK